MARFGHAGKRLLGELSGLIERQNVVVIAMAASVLHVALYLVPNTHPLLPPRLLPLSALDRAIPLLPDTVWLYFSDYLLVFIGFALCRSPGSRTHFVFAFLTAILVSTACHWLFPVAFPRELFPVPASTDASALWGLDLLRSEDSPLSCFPSLHVALAFLAALATWAEARRAFWPLMAWAVLVALSTLTTKQHYAVDVVSGIAVGVLAYALFCVPRDRRNLHSAR